MQDHSNIRIAFAEDHDSVRESIILFLDLLGGISIDIQANNGVELLKQLSSAERLPDICMIDFQMPLMDGHTVLIEIKKRWPEIKILVLTSFENEALMLRMIKAGANGYLLKSCKPQIIKEALEAIHANGYYYSQQATSKIFRQVENKTVKPIQFTEKEIDLIKYACTDLSYNEIAAEMKVSVKSIETRAQRVSTKLNVSNRAGIVMYAIQSGIVPL